VKRKKNHFEDQGGDENSESRNVSKGEDSTPDDEIGSLDTKSADVTGDSDSGSADGSTDKITESNDVTGDDGAQPNDESGDEGAEIISATGQGDEYKGFLATSFVAALIGAVLGVIPVTLIAFATGMIFYPLFIAAPLLTYPFNSLLKGRRCVGSIIIATIFSVASAYVSAVACQAALYISAHSMSVFQIPLLTALALGKPGVIPATVSAYAYPLVFILFGLAITSELLVSGGKKKHTVSVDAEENAEIVISDAEPENGDGPAGFEDEPANPEIPDPEAENDETSETGPEADASVTGGEPEKNSDAE